MESAGDEKSAGPAVFPFSAHLPREIDPRTIARRPTQPRLSRHVRAGKRIRSNGHVREIGDFRSNAYDDFQSCRLCRRGGEGKIPVFFDHGQIVTYVSLAEVLGGEFESIAPVDSQSKSSHGGDHLGEPVQPTLRILNVGCPSRLAPSSTRVPWRHDDPRPHPWMDRL